MDRAYERPDGWTSSPFIITAKLWNTQEIGTEKSETEKPKFWNQKFIQNYMI